MANSTHGKISSVTGNPFALGATAALVGIIAGALIPTLRKEEEALGSVATKLRVAGRDLAQDVVERDCGNGATRRAGSSARALDKTRTAQRRTCAVVVPARGSARPRPATKLGAHLR